MLRLIPDGTKIAFMKARHLTFPLSALLSIIAIWGFLAIGLHFGIDFKGGTLLEVQAKGDKTDMAGLRASLGKIGLGEVQLQEFGENKQILIRYAEQPGGDAGQQAALRKVQAEISNEYDIRRSEVVGPRVSGELVQRSTIGVVFAIMGVLVYLWFRFEWQFAVGAMIATVHDVVLTMGFYSFTKYEFDLTAVASVLTIIGYSLNDTVIVYDRVREMLRRYKRLHIDELIDVALNATLSRTIVTSITTSLALVGLYLFGGHVIEGFAASMLFGVVIGTYSSIFIAAPVLIYLGLRTGGFAAAAAANDKP